MQPIIYQTKPGIVIPALLLCLVPIVVELLICFDYLVHKIYFVLYHCHSRCICKSVSLCISQVDTGSKNLQTLYSNRSGNLLNLLVYKAGSYIAM